MKTCWMIDLQNGNYFFLILHEVLFSTKKRTCFWDPVPFFLDSSLGIPYTVLCLNACDKEHLEQFLGNQKVPYHRV